MATSHRRHRVAYDTLNVAAGARQSSFGLDEFGVHARDSRETSEGTDGPSE